MAQRFPHGKPRTGRAGMTFMGAVALMTAPLVTATAHVPGGTAHGAAGSTAPAVEAWGFGANGELGDGALGTAATPVAVKGLTGVASVSAGEAHSLALLSNGTVMAWGQNNYGQLGDGHTSSQSTVPVPVKGLTGVVSVSAGDGHSLALLSNGTVMAWGEDAFGQLGDGRRRPFSDVPVQVKGLAGVIQVAAGNMDSFAVLSSGTVMSWGNNAQGQLGDNANSDTSDVPVAVDGLTGAVAVAANGYDTLALLRSGAVMTWGQGVYGQIGNGLTNGSDVPVRVSTISHAVAIAAGDEYDVALLAAGTVEAWGNNMVGQLGDGRLDGGDSYNVPLPVRVKGLTGITAISAGNTFTLARSGNGTVYGWGDNSFGELAGAVRATVVDTPVALTAVRGAVGISAGGIHALATTSAPTGAAPVGPTHYGFAVSPTRFPENYPPLLGPSDTVTAISAASANNAWALVVGRPSRGSPNDLALHWNGTDWNLTKLAVPTAPGSSASFSGVYDAGRGDAWVVGTVNLSTGHTRTLIERWNGTAWTIVASPDPAGGAFGNDSLTAVSGSGPGNIWAIGDDFQGTGGGDIQILLAHFNGTRWTAAPTPTPSGHFQFGKAIDVASPTDAWAVGTDVTDLGNGGLGVAFHWDGTSWTGVEVPNLVTRGGGLDANDLTGVTIASPTDVWVSATHNNGPIPSVPYLLHSTGGAFSAVAVPSPGGPQAHADFYNDGTFLNAITSTAPDNVYAAGVATYNDDAKLAFVRHFNGKTWSTVPVPQVGDQGPAFGLPGEDLGDVASTRQGTVLLAGSQGNPENLLGTAPLVLTNSKP
jgi:alpha-tubulin suppressor-like RCC1 family protein